MAKVRCPCGRQYRIPDQAVGQPVKCAACRRTFVAKPIAASAATSQSSAPSRAKMSPARPSAGEGADAPAGVVRARPKPRAAARGKRRLGDLAVARGFVTREQLSACLEYQHALRTIPDGRGHRFGEILVEKGLLTRAQLESLLGEQSDDLADELAAAAREVPTEAPARRPVVTDEQRQLIRDQVAAAARQRARRPRRPPPAEALRGRVARLRGTHIVLAAALALTALVAVWLRPPPEPQRVLVAYLESCNELAVEPDRSLALRDLGLVVRRFDDVRFGPQVCYDYAGELAAASKKTNEASWADVLRSPGMSPQRRRALSLVVPAVPAGLTPRRMGGLRVRVQAATCLLTWKRRGAGSAFFDGRFRFFIVRVEGPHWERDWCVAGCEAIGPATAR